MNAGHRSTRGGTVARRKWLLKYPEAKVLNSARSSAWYYDREFSLKQSDIVIPPTCPVLGIPLFFTPGRRTANTPSLDRLDNSKGYTKDNVAVVSWRANDAKGDLSLPELKKLAAFYLPVQHPRLYLAGPMRGYKDYNFPAFDYAAKLLRAEGYFVFSPADNDRAKGRKDPPIRDCLLDDTHWICKHADVVALLPGWEKSTGAQAERSLALALGLSVTILGRKYYV
jgi:hypothetical protein